MKTTSRSRRRQEADFQIACMVVGLGLFFHASFASAQALIPNLRPPRGEIYPTFWEQHGWQTIIAAIVLLAFVAMLVFLFARPKPKEIEPPDVLARRALDALRGRTTDGALLMQVSRIFRRYVIFAFELPQQEMTTAELCRVLEAIPQTDPALVATITDFLHQCDEDKFSPLAPPARDDAASRALSLLEQIETHRRKLTVLENQPAS